MSKANERCKGGIDAGAMVIRERTIESAYKDILDALGIDWRNDPNTKGTPERVARMLCREVCSGRFTDPPALTVFPNTAGDNMQMTGPIPLRSLCSHHFCPITGKVWIGYIPDQLVLGLSKFNRVVDWYASRPQIQEELAQQIATHLENNLQPKGVAVWIQATHTCMTWRGVEAHPEAAMATSVARGVFRQSASARSEFLHFVRG